MENLKNKSQLTLIIQSLIVIILFFICEMLFFVFLTKPIFYGISIICLLITLGLCTFFKFNLFSFEPLKRKEIAIIIISFLFIEITTYMLTSFLPTPNNQEGLNKIVNQPNLFTSIITIGIFIPIIEECIFRGVLIKIIFQKNNG